MIRREVADALVAMIEQHAGRHQRAADVIQPDAAVGVSRHDAVDQHHSRHVLHKIPQLRIAQRFGVNDQRRTALANQYFNGVTLFFRFMIAIADKHIFLMLLGDGIYRFDQRAKKGVRHVHHDHADGIADLGRQRLRVGVGPIAQQRYRLHYRFSRIRAHQRAVIQHARNRSHGNPRLTGDITNGDHAHRPLGNCSTSHSPPVFSKVAILAATRRTLRE